MLAAAEEITLAAQKHERCLRLAALKWESLPDTSDYVVSGEAFAPLSQSLADWRVLMAAIFPAQGADGKEIAELESIVAGWGK